MTYKILLHQDEDVKVDMVILLVDASNLRRNLLFCSQIIDLKIPVVVALTMMDLAGKKGIEIDVGLKENWHQLFRKSARTKAWYNWKRILRSTSICIRLVRDILTGPRPRMLSDETDAGD